MLHAPQFGSGADLFSNGNEATLNQLSGPETTATFCTSASRPASTAPTDRMFWMDDM